MRCSDCLKKDYCPYIYFFNHDVSIACIDFIDISSSFFVSSTSLNIEEDKE